MTSTTAKTGQGGATYRWVLFLLVILTYAYSFRDSFAYLFHMWATEDLYSQGWLIAAVSLFLMATPVVRGKLTPGTPSLVFLPVLLGLSVIWGIGHLTQTSLLQLLVLPMIFWSCAVCCLGSNAGSQWRFPAAYFFLALPIWGLMQPILLSLTVDVTVFIVRLWGVPMHLVGNVVTIPAGRFEIVSGCSGAHQFAVAVAYTVLAAHLTQRSWLKQVFLIAFGIVLALIANWVRVASLVLIGEYTNMQHYLIQDEHVTFGWGLFVVMVVVPVLLLSRLLNRSDAASSARDADQRLPAIHKPFSLAIAGTVMTLVALSPGPILSGVAGSAGNGTAVELELPVVDAGWSGRGSVKSDWRPWYAGADQVLAGQYRRENRIVDLYVLSYYDETQGRELINQGNAIADPRSWKAKATGKGQIGSGAARPAWNSVLVTSAGGKSRLIRYWYDIAGRQTTGAATAKLLQALARLEGSPQSSLVAVSVECDDDCEGAETELDDFLAASGQRLIEMTRSDKTE